MPRRPRVCAPATPPVTPLRCNDLLFINAYLANGRNATQAYRTVFPNVKYTSANVGAQRMFHRTSVQAELAARLAVSGGVTRAHIESSLLRYQQWADAAHDYVAGAAIAMDAAKLAGYITEKREVRTLTDEDAASVRELVRASLHSPESLPQPSMRMVPSVGAEPVSEPVPASVTPTAGTGLHDTGGATTPHPTAEET